MDFFKLKVGKATAYKNYVASGKARELCDKVEKETGFKYLATYFPIIPASDPDYDVYEMWEFPNMAAYDKARDSNAFTELLKAASDFVDWDKPIKVVTLRTASDVKIPYEPPPKA